MKDAFKAVLSFILKILNAVKTVLVFLLCHPLLVGIVFGPVLIFGIALVATSSEGNPYETVAEQDTPVQEAPAPETPARSFARDGDGLYEWTGSFVLDAAEMLSAGQNEELSGYLLELNDTTGVQIAVLTLQTTGREPIHDFAVRQFEKWQLGQKGIDNGALLTIALADRKTDITTGDGIEGVLTDILCKTILDNVIAPAFREEKYGEGIIGAVHAMADTITRGNSLVTEETTPEAEDEISRAEPAAEAKTDDDWVEFLIYVAILILFVLYAVIKKHFGWGRSSYRSGGGSSRSGGGGHTSGGGASSGW